jgi:hypothetical protein
VSVVFSECGGVVVGIGARGRRWMARPEGRRWRLEYRDAGQPAATYVGTYGSLTAAKQRACRSA